MMKKLLSAAFVLSMTASAAFAGEYWNIDAGGTTMKFLSMHVSPRAAALSGAGVADPGRASEVTRNPLAMSVMDSPEFGVNHIVFDDGSAGNFTSAYFGHPVLDNFAFSLGVDFLGYDDLEGRDENGLETGSYGAYAWGLQAGFGSRYKDFNWALSARFATQTIDDESAFAVLGDIGGSYHLGRYFALGASLTNAGYVSEYDEVAEYAPMALQAGVTGFLPFAERWELHVSADAYRRADTDPQWLFGGELEYAEVLMLRMGYAVRPDTENGISCGLGFTFGMVVFDYAYAPRPAFEGGNHYLSLGMKF